MKIDGDELIQRATAAFTRSGKNPEPDKHLSECGCLLPGVSCEGQIIGKDHTGAYAVLRNVNGILAVYALLESGAIQRLKNWPAGFVEELTEAMMIK